MMNRFHFEIIPLVVNFCGFLYYLGKFDEPGKIFYWAGATLLTFGLLLLKG
jgi:hypothetical protein